MTELTLKQKAEFSRLRAEMRMMDLSIRYDAGIKPYTSHSQRWWRVFKYKNFPTFRKWRRKYLLGLPS